MDPSASSVSKVVHLSNLPRNVTEHDVRAVFSSFGSPAHIVILQNRNQALIEMEELSAAVGFVNYHSSVQCIIREATVGVEHSTHQALNRRTQATPAEAAPSRILLLTVSECYYPITIDVAHQILSPHGMVEKIVMFNKGAAPNTLNILAQFAHVESAKQALNTLQGQHVYQDACRLQIQFSKHEDLNVTRNGERTRDYLNSHLPSDSALLPTPPVPSLSGPGSIPSSVAAAAHIAHITPPGFRQPASAASPFAQAGTTVLLVTNLNSEKTTPTALFNLFSLFGPVERVKIFYNKPDQGLVQMGDQTAAQNAFGCLKGAVVFGKAMGVTFSKHRSVNASTPSADEQSEALLADFDQRSQRYRDGASAKTVTAPTSLLHISNLSHDTTSQQLSDHLSHIAHIVATKVFELNERTMGFVQFDSVEGATDALCAMHNQTLNGRTVRLAFSRKSLLKK